MAAFMKNVGNLVAQETEYDYDYVVKTKKTFSVVSVPIVAFQDTGAVFSAENQPVTVEQLGSIVTPVAGAPVSGPQVGTRR
jgi:hypothetical protein